MPQGIRSRKRYAHDDRTLIKNKKALQEMDEVLGEVYAKGAIAALISPK